jgi:hypothetical protein
MRSLPEKQSKAIGTSSRNSTDPDGQTTTVHGQTARFCSTTVRPPTRPIRPPAPGTKALGFVSGTRGHVHVTMVKLQCQQEENCSNDQYSGRYKRHNRPKGRTSKLRATANSKANDYYDCRCICWEQAEYHHRQDHTAATPPMQEPITTKHKR